MLKLWKGSTALFVLQLLAFWTVYFRSRDVETARIAVAALAGGIAIVAVGFVWAGEEMHERFCSSPTILSLALSAMFLEIPSESAFVVLIFGSALGICTLFAANYERQKNESIIGCFITALPGGFGMIVGGAILLIRWYINKIPPLSEQ